MPPPIQYKTEFPLIHYDTEQGVGLPPSTTSQKKQPACPLCGPGNHPRRSEKEKSFFLHKALTRQQHAHHVCATCAGRAAQRGSGKNRPRATRDRGRCRRGPGVFWATSSSRTPAEKAGWCRSGQYRRTEFGEQLWCRKSPAKVTNRRACQL